MPRSRFLSSTQLADDLGMTARGIRALAARGKLPGAVKVGDDWRFNATAIDRWLDKLPALTPTPLSARVGRDTRQAAPLTAEERQYFGLDGAREGRRTGRRQAADAGTKQKAKLAV
jgi:excisionase family DNA binding protein